MTKNGENALGQYLRTRRTGLDPAAFGLPTVRRRTPGLRREEVALRANISTAWYTWLEQGRGGAASADVLGRLARALMLTEIERGHLFMLGLGRPPEIQCPDENALTPRLQRMLDALPYSPAIVKNTTWDVLAWNRASAKVMHDFGQVPADQRNVLRMLFSDSQVRAGQPGWEHQVRDVVAAFRIDAARASTQGAVTSLVNELSERSPEFAAMWREHDVHSFGGIVKNLHHPVLGKIALESSSFVIDGRSDLAMVVWNPATPQDREALQAFLQTAEGLHPAKAESAFSPA